MSSCRVRIYSAENFQGEPMDIVGTSRSVGDLFGHPRMQAFLEEQNKEVAVLPKGLAPTGGESVEYWTVRPPFDDEQLQQFGKLCVEEVIDHDDGVYVVDQRQPLPVPTLYGGELIASS
jgi:hypothetical protein